MTTIVYRGPDYKQVKSKMDDLDKIFVVSDIHPEGDEKVGFAVMDTSKKLLEALGISKSPEDIHPSTRFCNLNKLELEPDSKLPARQKLWAWMVKCLQGNKAQAGPYFYLTQQCIPYDIAHLFKRLGEVLDTVTICALDDEVYNVTHLDFDPSNQDILATSRTFGGLWPG